MIESGLGKIQKSPVTWLVGLLAGFLIMATVNAVKITTSIDEIRSAQLSSDAGTKQLLLSEQAQIDELKKANAQQAVTNQSLADQSTDMDKRLTLMEERKP